MKNNNFKDPTKREEEFQQRIIDVARVTRVMKGGKRMNFRVCLGIGDKKGRVGMGLAKGSDITLAITKALAKAKKNIIKVPMKDETIIHPIRVKFKAAQLLLRPAKKGSGIKAGGAVRVMCELAGIPNISGKILGTNNKVNNVKALMIALNSFKVDKKIDTVKPAIQDNTPVPAKVESDNEKKEEGKKSLKDKLKNIINKKEDK